MPSLVDDIAVEHRPRWDPHLYAFVCRSCGFPCLCYLVAVAVIDSRGPHARPEAPGRRTETTGPGARLWRGRAPT